MYVNKSVGVNYEQITNNIIALIEAGTLPFGSQWKSNRNKRLPFNLHTGKMYRGMNILHLWVHEMQNKYTSNGWITLNQLIQIGKDREVKPSLIVLPPDHPNRGEGKTGQRSVPVFHADTFIPKEWRLVHDDLYQSTRTGDMKNGNQITSSYLKVAGHVFNLDQIENLPEEYQKFDPHSDPLEQEPQIKEMFQNYGVKIVESNSGICAYTPAIDTIEMVHVKAFPDYNDYIRVLFHEGCHSTGHFTRLARLPKEYGNPSKHDYAFEELVAELGAAFLGASFGLPGEMVHAAYIEHYLKVLKQDNRAIFKAANRANTAAEYLLKFLNNESAKAA